MSGGSYNYAYRQIDELAENISYKGGCSAASETLRKKFVEHLKLVSEVARAIVTFQRYYVDGSALVALCGLYLSLRAAS